MIFCSISFAEVWTDTDTWNDEWENKYSEWVRSSEVQKNIFVSKSSHYKGVIADCADVTYVFRAIFSFENRLKFSAKNPVATSTSSFKYFSNSMKRFDSILDPNERFVAFANYIGQSLGTETLTANDSFPLKIKSIKPSDFYVYKVKKNDSFIRHNYNIKNIDRRGNFEVIYSTQAIRDGGGELNQRIKALYNAPIEYKWGFRRYDGSISSDIAASSVTRSDISNEQFNLAKKLGERGFFSFVKSEIREEVENPETLIRNQFKEYCEQVLERIDIVNKSLDHQRILGGKCMEFADFDAHSTPSRDGRLKDIVNNLKLDYQELSSEQKKELTPETDLLIEGLFSSQPANHSLTTLSAYCPVSYKTGSSANLRDIRMRLAKGLLSSHPNDTVELRWGETKNGKTKCKAFY